MFSIISVIKDKLTFKVMQAGKTNQHPIKEKIIKVKFLKVG